VRHDVVLVEIMTPSKQDNVLIKHLRAEGLCNFLPANNAGQGDLLLQPATDKLNLSAGPDHVEQRQRHDWS